MAPALVDKVVDEDMALVLVGKVAAKDKALVLEDTVVEDTVLSDKVAVHMAVPEAKDRVPLCMVLVPVDKMAPAQVDKVVRDKAMVFSLDKVVRLSSDTRVYEDLHTFWLSSQIDWNTLFRIWDTIRENFIFSAAKDLLTVIMTSKEDDSVLSIFVFEIDYHQLDLAKEAYVSVQY
jgi:hypothetical protein